MPAGEDRKSMPVILLCSVIAVAVLAIGWYAFHMFRGEAADIPNREVRPGMYDFRKEAQSGNLGRRGDTR